MSQKAEKMHLKYWSDINENITVCGEHTLEWTTDRTKVDCKKCIGLMNKKDTVLR